MTNDNDTLPQSTTELTALVRELQAKVWQQSLFTDQLLEQIRLARHQHFGARSERFSLDQLALAFNEAEASMSVHEEGRSDDQDDTVAVPAHRRKKGGRRRLPKAFPRVEVLHEFEESECCCDQCAAALGARQGHELRRQAVAKAHRVPRGRQTAHGQQPRGERDPAVRHRPQELFVLRHGQWRQCQRQSLQPVRNGQGQQHRTVCLSQDRVHRVAECSVG